MLSSVLLPPNTNMISLLCPTTMTILIHFLPHYCADTVTVWLFPRSPTRFTFFQSVFFFFCSTRAHSDTFTYYRGHVYGDGVMLFNTDSIRGDSIGVFFLFFFSLFSVDTRYYQRRYCIIRPSSDDVRIVVVVYAVVIRVVAVSPGDVRRGERLFPKRSKKSKSFVHKTIYFHIVVQEREGKKRTRRCAPFYARHPKQQLLWRTTVT